MIDQNSQFLAILTTIGTAKQANANALGIAWKITQMGVGDASGADPIPSAAQTALINERRRAPLNQLKVDPTNSAIIVAEQVIPEDVGGWWIREIGLYDADGDLVAIANCAPSFKPLLAQGSGRTQVVRMNLIVSNASNVELKIDPSVVLATRAYVDGKVLEELNKLDNKQSVRVATTANIALAGLQTIDAVALVAGDRVLVKNQTVPKDNGIYVAAAAVWTRAPDADTNAEVTSALLTSVEQGATLADTRWQMVSDGVIVVGTTALTFQDVTQGFAPINSPALINPTANTPAQFSSNQSLATTEFVQRALGNHAAVSILSATATLTAAHCGGAIRLLGTGYTVTLPLLGPAAPNSAKIVLRNEGTGAITLAAQGADKFASASGLVSSLSLGVWDSVELVVIGGVWAVMGGSLGLASAAFMNGANFITQPLFTADKAFATTEFVQRAIGNLGNMTIYTGNANMPVTDFGRIVLGNTGLAITLTLPAIGGVPTGSTIYIRNVGAGPLTVVPPAGGSMSVIATANLPSVVVNPGSSLEVTVQGTNYFLAGSATLKHISDFGAAIGFNGFQKMPGGTILQRGSGGTVNGTATISFPMAFPSACRQVIAFESGANGWSASNFTVYGSTGKTVNGVTIKSLSWNGSSFSPSVSSGAFDYIAVGE
jgi:hypothetical protein